MLVSGVLMINSNTWGPYRKKTVHQYLVVQTVFFYRERDARQRH